MAATYLIIYNALNIQKSFEQMLGAISFNFDWKRHLLVNVAKLNT